MSCCQGKSLGPRSASPQVSAKSCHYVADSVSEFANVQEGDIFYDLGCNDGRLLLSIARHTGARCVGVELDAAAVELSRKLIKDAGLHTSVNILQEDLMECDLSAATVVFTYLLPQGVQCLSQKLKAELRPGARVISYMFRYPGWEQYLKASKGVSSGCSNKMDVSNVSRLYLYEIPGKQDAAWNGTDDLNIAATLEESMNDRSDAVGGD